MGSWENFCAIMCNNHCSLLYISILQAIYLTYILITDFHILYDLCVQRQHMNLKSIYYEHCLEFALNFKYLISGGYVLNVKYLLQFCRGPVHQGRKSNVDFNISNAILDYSETYTHRETHSIHKELHMGWPNSSGSQIPGHTMRTSIWFQWRTTHLYRRHTKWLGLPKEGSVPVQYPWHQWNRYLRMTRVLAQRRRLPVPTNAAGQNRTSPSTFPQRRTYSMTKHMLQQMVRAGHRKQ